MGDLAAEDDREFCYHVQLTGRPPESLRSRYPSMTVHTTGAQTALRRRCEGPEQLDDLIHELAAIGLTLTDVHRVTTKRDRTEGAEVHNTWEGVGEGVSSATYEVRVAGVLGRALLRHLRCSHYAIPEQTLVRQALAAAELNRFLRACTECGATLERVWRVDSRLLEAAG